MKPYLIMFMLGVLTSCAAQQPPITQTDCAPPVVIDKACSWDHKMTATGKDDPTTQRGIIDHNKNWADNCNGGVF